jgi:arabinogalactan endo-1,4-beta-galactosidase
MKLKNILIAALLACSTNAFAQRYAGGDISLLPEYEDAGAKYYSTSGKSISSPLSYFAEEGMNAMRLRLFVAPDKYTGSDKDPNACQDLDYVCALGRRIKDAGFKLMLDIHYSDTWADPAKQWTPKDWEGLTDDQLYEKIYDYTHDVLSNMVNAGATPDFIQTGNEISYGMLWGAYGSSSLKKCYMNSDSNWSRFTKLLSQAGKACREVCPEAKIVLHTERAAQTNVLTDFYSRMSKAAVDYDIIGLSYYPFFHGNLDVLENAIKALETNFAGKQIMIVETGYPYAWEVPGTTFDYTATYPYSSTGQKQFTADLVSMLAKHNNVTGIFWWWMEYNARGTQLSGWYNAPLFDSRTGYALPAISELSDFIGDTGVNSIVSNETKTTDHWYNLQGEIVTSPLPAGIYIHNHKKVIIR